MLADFPPAVLAAAGVSGKADEPITLAQFAPRACELMRADLQWIAGLADEGHRFLQDFGGVGGVLRYDYLGGEQVDNFPEDGDEDEDEDSGELDQELAPNLAAATTAAAMTTTIAVPAARPTRPPSPQTSFQDDDFSVFDDAPQPPTVVTPTKPVTAVTASTASPPTQKPTLSTIKPAPAPAVGPPRLQPAAIVVPPARPVDVHTAAPVATLTAVPVVGAAPPTLLGSKYALNASAQEYVPSYLRCN
eukprot:m.623861 g.623861  ORF g.623861 m.623861 type:complete len:247 (+) comp58225_c0_seq29:277-1017(+)